MVAVLWSAFFIVNLPKITIMTPEMKKKLLYVAKQLLIALLSVLTGAAGASCAATGTPLGWLSCL